MAKKTRKGTATEQGVQPPSASFDESFPTIARWISQEEGWVELGADHYSRSLARALYGGGMVWEASDDYGSLNDALRAMEEGIASWLDEFRPEWRPSERAETKPPPSPPGRSSTRRKTSSKATRPKRGNRVKADATPTVSRSAIEKVRKFADIAEALRRGGRFEITRLTSIKGLCKDQGAARSFALFLAVSARRRAEEKKGTERVRELMERTIKEMRSYLDDPSKERKERLYPLLREMEREQDEYKRIGWARVRIVRSMELVVVEEALKSILRDDDAPTWLYQAARDYAERYDPHYGTGLIPDSAPMMEEIADFWQDYYGIGR